MDGVFGPLTERAVRAFQQDSGLVVDGIAGPMTFAALDQDDADVDGDTPGDVSVDEAGAPHGDVFGDESATDWVALKRNVVRIAEEERKRWHSGGRKTETDPAMTPVLKDYFAAGVNVTVSDEEIQAPVWQRRNPWSATFISWVMRQAGAGSTFAYSRAHQRYIAAAKRNREEGRGDNPFWALRATEYAPEVGDIVCAERANSGATYENIHEGFRPCHCDIVTRAEAGRLTVIGGNVGDSVGRKTVRLDDDGLIDRQGPQRRFFAIIKIRTDRG